MGFLNHWWLQMGFAGILGYTHDGVNTVTYFPELGMNMHNGLIVQPTGSSLSIDLSSSSPGLYLVKWNTVNHRYFGKVMLE